MKTLIHESETFELYAEVTDCRNLKTLTITSIWPNVRNPANKVPHVLYQTSLPPAALQRLGLLLFNPDL